METMLNFSPASERNKAIILDTLRTYLEQHQNVLEIGSGSGQHAMYIAPHFKQLHWSPSELAENVEALVSNLSVAKINNISEPCVLDVTQHDWNLKISPDLVFTANTLHIMPEAAVRHFFHGVGRVITQGGRVCIYGPFKYAGEYTSDSNAEFDLWLKARDPLSGIRDFDLIVRWADEAGLILEEDIPMPANNQMLVWKKI